MPIDRTFVGREYPASQPYEVGREHVRSFADAVGDPSPLYRDREAARAAGHPDVVAPPTFLTVLTNRFGGEGPLADPALGLDYAFVVHGEQHFALHRPVHVGDVLTSVVTIADIKDVGRNESMTLLTEVTDAGGAQVATLTTTIVSRGTAAPKTEA
ncbi:MAG: MaoC domain protein dehydratase [Frankiales bacterium]|nr:MaoC domain protein dehydratase [Frankiales bacterium]